MTVFVFTIFLSAFLLFQVQPLIGRHILPWFGGSPAVWTTCLLFFQFMLIAGYGYAHWLAGLKHHRNQGLLHLLVLAGTVFLLPVVPESTWMPQGDESPSLLILGLLMVTVGGPYFVLSTTGPLLQSWFRRVHRHRSPYRLYAVSNAGSLLGLITYPFVFEPLLTRQAQAVTWSVSYVAFVLGCGWCAWKLAGSSHTGSSRTDDLPGGSDEAVHPELVLHRPGTGRVLSWLFLSFGGSVLLLATTNQMCQNVTVVPLLWILPLSIYLATFIISFERDNWYRRTWSIPLYAAAGALVCGVLTWGEDMQLKYQLIVYSLMLFAGCMICHGELARRRPEPGYLTHYFLIISGGGALGGFFVALAAPVLFPDYWEYHLAAGGAGIVALAALYFDMKSPFYNGRKIWAWIPMLLAFSVFTAFLVRDAKAMKEDSLVTARSFFGVLNVAEKEDDKGVYRELYHGEIVHGIQYTEMPWRSRSTAYYGKDTGVWLAIQSHPRRKAGRPVRIGVIGLGTGTIASLAGRGDVVRFYEINPDVVRLSNEWFTYRRDSGASVEVVLGDARIQLERELAKGDDQQFDVLVADAFSGDAIPLHLLTRECARLYRRHLKDDGILAIHISNHYMDLVPVTLGLADVLGWEIVLFDTGDNIEDAAWSSTWMIITDNRSFLDADDVRQAETPLKGGYPEPVFWSDEYASLLHVINF